jgi:hypothetical protein
MTRRNSVKSNGRSLLRRISMITKVNTRTQDIEDAVVDALDEFREHHNKTPCYLVLGRLAYEELIKMQSLGHGGTPGPLQSYNGLEIAVVEEPEEMLAIGCKPD